MLYPIIRRIRRPMLVQKPAQQPVAVQAVKEIPAEAPEVVAVQVEPIVVAEPQVAEPIQEPVETKRRGKPRK